jgi:hypothetical protein
VGRTVNRMLSETELFRDELPEGLFGRKKHKLEFRFQKLSTFLERHAILSFG